MRSRNRVNSFGLVTTSTQVNATLLRRVALTDAQKDIIAMGFEVYARIRGPLRQQWQDVTAQIQAAEAAAEAAAQADAGATGAGLSSGQASGSRSSGPGLSVQKSRAAALAAAARLRGSSSSSGSSSRAGGALRAFDVTQQHREQQQQLAARLKVLLAKE